MAAMSWPLGAKRLSDSRVVYLGTEYMRYEYVTSRNTTLEFWAPCPITALGIAAAWEDKNGITASDREVIMHRIKAVLADASA